MLGSNLPSLSDNDFNVIHLYIYIRSVNKNPSELLIYIFKHRSAHSVIVSNESRLKTTDAWVEVPGYRVIHSVREKHEN